MDVDLGGVLRGAFVLVVGLTPAALLVWVRIRRIRSHQAWLRTRQR